MAENPESAKPLVLVLRLHSIIHYSSGAMATLGAKPELRNGNSISVWITEQQALSLQPGKEYSFELKEGD